jgi:hypothetical protein
MIIKYTLNIPRELYHKLCVRTGKNTKYLGRKSTFLRELLEDALTNERIPSETEFKTLNKGTVTKPSLKTQLWWVWYGFKRKYVYHLPRASYLDLPKRFEGFKDGLTNPSLWIRFKSKKEAYLAGQQK